MVAHMTGWSWPGSTVDRVIDGDTINAVVTRDLGFGGRVVFPVQLRLNRINCPPLSTPVGVTAAAYVVKAVTGATVLIETLAAYKYGGPSTSPGEWMAEVTLPDGSNLSDALVKAGLAVYWNGQGPRPGG